MFVVKRKTLVLLAAADVFVLALVFVFLAMASSGGEQGIAFGLVYLLSFIFLALPLGVLILAMAIATVANKQRHPWFIVYVVIALGLRIWCAALGGFFDKAVAKAELNQRIKEDPALYDLQTAVSSGPRSNIDKVRAALSSGADANASVFVDQLVPVLVIAASRSDTAVVKALLEFGADPNLRAAVDMHQLSKPSPLDVVFFSEFDGQRAVFKMLLDHGADPTQSAIELGLCWQGEFELYRQYRQDQAKLADKQQNNCLHLAAKNDQPQFLRRYLLEYDSEQAAMNALNSFAQTPLDIAGQRKHYAAALALIKSGAHANKPWTLERLMNDDSDSVELAALKSLLVDSKSRQLIDTN